MRRFHQVEPNHLPECLLDLKFRKTPGVEDIEDLERELRQPLLTFEEMARAIGYLPDTLTKSMRKGTKTLPFPMISLGPRTRLFRPLDVILWREHGVVLTLPKPLVLEGYGEPGLKRATPELGASLSDKAGRNTPARAGAKSADLVRISAVQEPEESAPATPEERKKAVFGQIGANKRTLAGNAEKSETAVRFRSLQIQPRSCLQHLWKGLASTHGALSASAG